MRMGIGGCILILLACSGDPWWARRAPGSQLVLEFAQAWGVAWPPAAVGTAAVAATAKPVGRHQISGVGPGPVGHSAAPR